MFKKLVVSLFAVLLISGGISMAEAGWDKVFKQSDKVTIKKVNFKNRYGIKLVGDLYQIYF